MAALIKNRRRQTFISQEGSGSPESECEALPLYHLPAGVQGWRRSGALPSLWPLDLVIWPLSELNDGHSGTARSAIGAVALGLLAGVEIGDAPAVVAPDPQQQVRPGRAAERRRTRFAFPAA